MIEKPIGFSGPMVRAILAGRKTQTRRVIRGLSRHWVQGITPQQYRPGDFAFLDMADPIGTYPTMFTAPYAPGDLLVVKQPLGAARIKLKVLTVRCEHVQDISNEDILDEGIEPVECHTGDEPDFGDGVIQFEEHWDSLNARPKARYRRLENGKRIITHYESYPWEDIQETRTHRGKPWRVQGNPWVYVYEFERR